MSFPDDALVRIAPDVIRKQGRVPKNGSVFFTIFQTFDRWWVINVDIATDLDMAGQDIDEDGVTPGSLLIMQILGQVALGEHDEAWELYRAFVESESSA